jgi:hypothetical protein
MNFIDKTNNNECSPLSVERERDENAQHLKKIEKNFIFIIFFYARNFFLA